MTIKLGRRCLLSGLMVLLPGVTALGADFPLRPITIVVPYTAGGGGDVLARLFAEKLKARFSLPVLVDNKPGAGTLIGSEFVARAPADGYTLLLTTNTLLIAPILNAAAAKFDPQKDFAPVLPLASIAIIMVANPALPTRDAGELIASASNQVLKDSEFAAKLEAAGLSALGGSLESCRSIIRNDFATWQKVIKDGNITLQ